MISLVTEFGLGLVFALVLIEQLGAPIPAMPMLIVAGALTVDGTLAGFELFGLAFAACMIADAIWYAAGRLYGRRVMKILCRVSLSPDSCVRQTEFRFERWGRPTLVLAKFVPGLSTIARPLAGAMQLSWPSFLLWNGVGAARLCGAAIGLGMLFHAEVERLILALQDLGTAALEVVVALLAVYVALKWLQRRRFHKLMGSARITVDRLHWLMHRDERPLVVDLRSPAERDQDRRTIPGALPISADELDRRLDELPRDRDIIIYCSCPNEEAAAYVTRRLARRGYTRVHPLLGGLDAWVAAGYEIEMRTAAGTQGASMEAMSPATRA